MKKINNKNNFISFFPILLLPLSFSSIIFFFLAIFLFPAHQMEAIEKKEAWLFYSESQPDVTFNSDYVNYIPNTKPNERLVMSSKLTINQQDPTLLLIGDHQNLIVYLDDHQLFTNVQATDTFSNKYPGRTHAFVSLPQDYQGKTLRIYVSSPLQSFAGYPAEVYFGTANALIGYIFKHSLPNLFILLFTGLVCILHLLYATFAYFRHKKPQLSALLLSGFALSAGLEAGFNDMLSGLLFSDRVNSTMLNLLAIITPMLLIGFYFSKMIYSRRFYGKWLFFHYSVGTLVALWGIILTRQLPMMMNYIFILNIVSTFITAFAAIYEAMKKNQFYVLCAPWIVLAAIGHCYLHIQNVLHLHQSPTNWKVILFLMLVIIFTFYELLCIFCFHEDIYKTLNLARLKLMLHESKHLLAPKEGLDRSKSLEKLQLQTALVKEQIIDQQKEAAILSIEEILKDIQKMKTTHRQDEDSLLLALIARYQEQANKKSIRLNLSLCPKALNRLPEDHWLLVCIHLIELGLRQAYEIQDPQKRNLIIRTFNTPDQMKIECCVSSNSPSKKILHAKLKTQKRKHNVDLNILSQIVEDYQGTLQISDELNQKKHVLTFQLP